jgi:hypothetical protein
MVLGFMNQAAILEMFKLNNKEEIQIPIKTKTLPKGSVFFSSESF